MHCRLCRKRKHPSCDSISRVIHTDILFMQYLNAAPCFIGATYAEQMSVHPPLISSEQERKCLSGVSLWDISLNCCYLSLWNIDSAGGKDWQLHESLLAGLLAEAKRFDIQTLSIGRARGRLLPSQTRDNYPSENHYARGISHTHTHTRALVPGRDTHCDIYTGEQDW